MNTADINQGLLYTMQWLWSLGSSWLGLVHYFWFTILYVYVKGTALSIKHTTTTRHWVENVSIYSSQTTINTNIKMHETSNHKTITKTKLNHCIISLLNKITNDKWYPTTHATMPDHITSKLPLANVPMSKSWYGGKRKREKGSCGGERGSKSSGAWEIGGGVRELWFCGMPHYGFHLYWGSRVELGWAEGLVWLCFWPCSVRLLFR